MEMYIRQYMFMWEGNEWQGMSDIGYVLVAR
jgi:hypothetical protein